MRLAEQRLWDSFKRNLPRNYWAQRVENIAGEGMPDVYVCGPAKYLIEFWVELKAPKRPKRPTTRLLGNDGLRKAQINWHLKAVDFAVTSYILIRDDTGELFFIEGRYADRINDWTVEELRAVSIASGWKGLFA